MPESLTHTMEFLWIGCFIKPYYPKPLKGLKVASNKVVKDRNGKNQF